MSTPSQVIRPEDWDEASHAVSDAYFPHTLTPLSQDSAADMRVQGACLGPVRITRITWGADVSVQSDHPGAYGVNIPLSGRLESVTGRNEVVSTSGLATICPPDTSTRITRWSRTCEIIGVRIDRDHLQREMGRILARPGHRLPPQVDLTTPAGASWLRFVESLSDQLADARALLHNDLVARQLSGAVTTAFVLAAVPDDPADVRVARPRIVKRVLDELHGDPARAWTAGDMAEVAGVSVRRLQEGFRQYVGASPSEVLLGIRLERVHDALLAATPHDTVTDIALRWGFTHTGRFAAAYRRRYGVAPSESLRGT
ncbi:AraC family transcriptional regulator [Rhodococcus daqingensis]|uniref:AraC family transcriptional regulator n=1 Tax=Rhodococcus daqingensis TaxID=2479363 RepID=A0ABW2S4Z4_9NOCA